jgi:hypothetical protein
MLRYRLAVPRRPIKPGWVISEFPSAAHFDAVFSFHIISACMVPGRNRKLVEESG